MSWLEGVELSLVNDYRASFHEDISFYLPKPLILFSNQRRL